MRTIIVDDEPQIREGLKILLKQTEVKVIAEASNVEDAKEAIEQLKPQLVLLDIQLQTKTGFDVLDALSYKQFKIVFITAYNNYAIKAFKYNAFDYILKPVDSNELYDTIKRISKEKYTTDLSLLKTNTKLNKIVIRTTENIFKIPLEDIVRCQADQGYTHFYLNNGKHILSSKSLKEYNDLLPENQFVRVHQSHLVNWAYVNAYNKVDALILSNREKVPVSVRKKRLVIARFKN